MPVALQAGLAVLVSVAGLSDLATRRIPNWITVPGAVLGIALQVAYGGWRGGAVALAGMALGFGIFLLLYTVGGMGAGDVKLFAAAGTFLGPGNLVLVFVITGLIGGIAAVLLALARGRLRQTMLNTGQLLLSFGAFRWDEVKQRSVLAQPGALRLPYGAVIAAATLLFVAFGN
jgi:prepilin peptidase CpaA